MHELILGGQRSGKSRTAEARAAQWLARSAQHEALLLATATAGDAEMAARIARHRADRARTLPRLRSLDVAQALPEALRAHSAPQRLLLVDCLTLWMTQLLMPLPPQPPQDAAAAQQALLAALAEARGPVVLVSNEIGLGVSPLPRQARAFVDALGRLHQAVAAACARVTFMVAGLEVPVKPGVR
ncbi:MAG: bifunctional adenosylcobinamide kinase/adenosylcobinamide-phosphate guanylyltransferase [Pseudomonadota bacterium]